jgi:hypothetical protein
MPFRQRVTAEPALPMVLAVAQAPICSLLHHRGHAPRVGEAWWWCCSRRGAGMSTAGARNRAATTLTHDGVSSKSIPCWSLGVTPLVYLSPGSAPFIYLAAACAAPSCVLGPSGPPLCLPWCGCTLGPGVMRTGWAGSSRGGRRRRGGHHQQHNPSGAVGLPLIRPGVELLYRLPMRPVSLLCLSSCRMDRSPLL